MGKLVIAISRAYGSGGRLIGQKLAAQLGIPYYDRAIIEMAAEKSGFAPEYIERMEEKASSSFLFNLVVGTTPMTASYMLQRYDVPTNITAFSAQAAVITELSQKSDCVIVGRCAEYILKDDPDCIKVLLYADREDRLKRIIEVYGEDEKTADSHLARIDKGRLNYYKNFTGEKWGEASAHDLCINTSKTGVDGAIKIIKAFIEAKREHK